MHKRLASALANLLVLALSVGAAVVLSEITLALLDYPAKPPARFLFFSRPNLQDQKTAFGYQPNLRVREVAVYRVGEHFTVEYDCTFATNNFGLVQQNPVTPGKPAVVVIGDSFTQGQGARPWFYELEGAWRHPHCQLVNLGLIGTGVRNWLDMLRGFAGVAEIKQVVMLFISHDWLRPRWVAQENAQGAGLCFEAWNPGDRQMPSCRQPLIHFLEGALEERDVLARAAAIHRGAAVFEPGRLLRQSHLGRLATHWRALALEVPRNMAAFEAIQKLVGPQRLTAVHLPDKDEAIRGEYSALGERVRAWLRAREVRYVDGLEVLGLSRSDFHPRDAHPNAAGYAKILHLVHNLLREQGFQ